MKLTSPLTIRECREALREQVSPLPVIRVRLFRKRTSRVAGQIEESRVVLESTIDVFSKQFVGVLSATPNGCVLEGGWHTSFWSRIWGSPRIAETEILEFLNEHGRFRIVS